ncbi:hypothetical protein LCGC14_0630370 [marine sediment metagenome]|uniref:Uncharacterized protein n=1 Tax=marine sediment metagenome TaxID=412755 RepID=A0A0F9UAP0_9ZZZZ
MSSTFPQVNQSNPDLPEGLLSFDEEFQLANRVKNRGLARERLIPFCEFTYGGYRANWHHELIAEKLEAVLRGELKRVMFFAPPRHGKSELCSVRFPAFYLGHKPQDSIIACSYAENLACTFSRATRACVRSPQYHELWPIKLSRKGDVRWQLDGKKDERPSYIAAGINGSVSGEGANLLIIDDPIKTAKQAYSKGYRDDCWNWYRLVGRTRLQPDASIILMMTRWHDDDLAGRIIQQMKEDPTSTQWEIVVLPAENLEGGEGHLPYPALWPTQYSTKALADIQKDIGLYAWWALYQQSPRIASGTVFKREWWPIVDLVPELAFKLQVWDTAFGGDDYSVCQTTGIRLKTEAPRFIGMDVWRDRPIWPDLKQAAVDQYEKHKPDVVAIELKATGISLIQDLQATHPHIPVIGIDIKNTPHPVRTAAVVTQVANGQYGLARGEWNSAFIDEHSEYPLGAHDDQVTTTVHILNLVVHGGYGTDGSKVVIFDALNQLPGADQDQRAQIAQQMSIGAGY